jgi:hypothetical protein
VSPAKKRGSDQLDLKNGVMPPAKGKYFDCYVMIYIYSRYIVGS